ncbi:variable large family protein [Borrelia persica]|uniref:variable large family protein n=1 Tax=Borrelia persica TaxID=44448 RepID=UPI000463C950|nr:variable large family protein [Borrelia persica]
MKKPLSLLIMMNLFVGCDVIAGLKTSLDEDKDVLRDSAIKIIGQDPGHIIDSVGNAALKIVGAVDGDVIGVAQEVGGAIISGVSQVTGDALNLVKDVASDVADNSSLGAVSNIASVVVDVVNVVDGVLKDFVIGSSSIKSDDKRGKIKEYFRQVEKSLTDIKSKLDSSSGNVASKPNVSGVNEVKKANEVIEKLITAIKKLIEAVGNDNVSIGEIGNSSTKASIVSDQTSVKNIIDGVKEIVDLAKASGVSIQVGDAGNKVEANTNTAALAALNGGQGGVGVGAGSALAGEVSKADAGAMIDKIKAATVTSQNISGKNENNAGELITGYTSDSKGAGAKSNADLAAAVALKAMSKNGRFSVPSSEGTTSEYTQKIKEAASVAVNKVLNTLGSIISQTVKIEIEKINKAIKN